MCRLLLDDNLMIYPLTPQLLIGSNLQIEKKVFSRKAVTQRLYYYHRPPPLCRVKFHSPPTVPFDVVHSTKALYDVLNCTYNDRLWFYSYDCIVKMRRLPCCLSRVVDCVKFIMFLQFLGLPSNCFKMQWLNGAVETAKNAMMILPKASEWTLSLQQFVQVLSDWHNCPKSRYNLSRFRLDCIFSKIVSQLMRVVSLICGVAAEVYGLFAHLREEDMRAVHSLPIFAKADSLHHNCLNVFAIQAILVKIA